MNRMEGNVSLGELLSKSRRKKGYTQEELGRKVNVDKSTISSYERDRTVPDYYTLNKLIVVLDIPIRYMLEQKKYETEYSEDIFPTSILYEIYMIIKDRDREDQALLLQFLKRF